MLPSLVDFDARPETVRETTTTALLSNGIPPQCKNGTTNPYWERWPALRGNFTDSDNVTTQKCQFFLGIGDGAAANCGSKCHTSNRIAVTIGTSAAARVCLPLPIQSCAEIKVDVPHGLFCYRVDKHRILVGGALTDGGSVVEWARKLLNLQSEQEFDAALQDVTELYDRKTQSSLPPSQSAALMIPFLSGERSTGFRGSATGCIAGITRETTSVDILYACLEGVTLRLKAVIGTIYDIGFIDQDCRYRLQQDDVISTVLVVSGNALERNSLWRQMIADCIGCSVVVDGDSSEGTSRGVAMLISSGIQQSEIREEELSVVNESRPNKEAYSLWASASLNQDKLINAVSNTWD
jgi:gluconokinase